MTICKRLRYVPVGTVCRYRNHPDALVWVRGEYDRSKRRYLCTELNGPRVFYSKGMNFVYFDV